MNKVAYNSFYGGFYLSKPAQEYLLKKYGIKPTYYGSIDNILNRYDPRLIDVIETLGDLASSELSKLKIKEIDSDIYMIESYDGLETVVVPNDLDWIKIK